MCGLHLHRGYLLTGTRLREGAQVAWDQPRGRAEGIITTTRRTVTRVTA
jgi:hypothetical protein